MRRGSEEESQTAKTCREESIHGNLRVVCRHMAHEKRTGRRGAQRMGDKEYNMRCERATPCGGRRRDKV